jgi:hypothetical protein
MIRRRFAKPFIVGLIPTSDSKTRISKQCSSMVEQQAHNLKGVGSIPTTATKQTSIVSMATRRSPKPKFWVQILVLVWVIGPSFKYGVVGKLVKPQDFHS